jgi:hypothetical protein
VHLLVITHYKYYLMPKSTSHYFLGCWSSCVMCRRTQSILEVFHVESYIQKAEQKIVTKCIESSSSNGVSTLPWWRGLWVPVTLSVKPAVALFSVRYPKRGSSRGKKPDEERCWEEGNSDTNYSDAGSSDASNDLKHKANDAWDGSCLYSIRCDQSVLIACCTVMWKANGKSTTLLLFLGSLSPKTETNMRCFLWRCF